MKNSVLFILKVLFFLFPTVIEAQSSFVTLNAEVKSAGNEAIPGAYIKIFIPQEIHAIDSFFTNEEGKIIKELPVAYTTGLSEFSAENGMQIITKTLSPSIASAKVQNYSLEYHYPLLADLYFLDIQGRKLPNNSILSSGIYFYFLEFEDRQKSKVYKLIVSEKCILNVSLTNRFPGIYKSSLSPKKSSSENIFIMEIVKDGYISQIDTVEIVSPSISINYQLLPANLPTAAFSYSGNLLVGQAILFDGSLSFGGNGEALIYSWDFGDAKKGQSVKIPHLYTLPGNYEVKLTVSGDFGAKKTITKSIIILPGEEATQHDGILNAYISDKDQTELENVEISLVESDMSALTNNSGIAHLSGLAIGIPIHLRIKKDGYVNQIIEITIPENSKQADFFVTLKKRMPAITFDNAEYGGNLMGSDGTNVILPIEALVKEDGSAVRGKVQVSITPVDVAFEASSFPGSFEAFNDDGEDGVLLSYGVSEFNFFQGEDELQLAEGKTAIVYIPIYTGGTDIGDEIPLWSVNEENGKWVQEGIGTVVNSMDSPTGMALKAEVGHFSWWNCDDFEDDRKRQGLCWRWECTTSQCYKVKVGCWMSGAQRGSGGGSKKVLQRTFHADEDRLDIPPVFEVREYVPESGSTLRFPSNSDVYVEARGFDEKGDLYSGNYTVKGIDESDTFKIELISVLAGDTIDLPLNSLYEDYLEPGQLKYYKIETSEKDDYLLFFEKGINPVLEGIFYASDLTGELLSGRIDQGEHLINSGPGSITVAVAGQNEFSEGNFLIGISELDPVLSGDTIDMAMNSTVSGSLLKAEFIHYRLTIPEEGLYRIDMPWPANPILQARYRVSYGEKVLRKGIVNEEAEYFFSGSGEIIVTVAGKLLTDEGNYLLKVDAMDTNPVELNDSVYRMVSGDEKFEILSFQSNVNTVLETSFYVYQSPSNNGSIKLISPDGRILEYESIYPTKKHFFTSMVKDSIYYFEISAYEDFKYVLINEDRESILIEYGDTIRAKIEEKGEVDAYHFIAEKDDIIYLQGTQPDYQLSKGMFKLINENGGEIALREINYYSGNYDFEIMYKIPENGTYSVFVYSDLDDTGSYQIVLDTPETQKIGLNTLLELEVNPQTSYYFELDIEKAVEGHFSIISDDNGGSYNLWDEKAVRLSTLSSYRYYQRNYYANYTGKFNRGKILLKLDNTDATKIYINFKEAIPLILDQKASTQFVDTIHQKNQINVYRFKGNPGDGFHTILNKVDGKTAPEKLSLYFYSLNGTGLPFNAKTASLGYYSLDSSILVEAGEKLTGEANDSVWVIVTHAVSDGFYDFNYHKVNSDKNIIVDDNFTEHPEAQTSSHIAAGYAVKSGGNILLASGYYSSFLSLMVNADNVILKGQEKSNTLITNVRNEPNIPVINFNSEGGLLADLSLSCGTRNYNAIEFSKDFTELDNINIRPLKGKIELAGGIKGWGNYASIHNISVDSSLWGLEISSTGGIIENCDIKTKSTSVKLTGDSTLIRNNIIETGYSARAIIVISPLQTESTQIVENNTIQVTEESTSSDYGVIAVERNGLKGNKGITYVRNNTIYSSGLNSAFYAQVGYPDAKIIFENNLYNCTNSKGSRAILMNAGRTDGSGSIIVRNNIFKGLTTWDAIRIYGMEAVDEDHYFAICNNNFSLAPEAVADTNYNFIDAYKYSYDFKDTANLFFINNIFEGNGSCYYVKFNDNFSFYSDYNILHNFRKYTGVLGNLIGTGNDVLADPLYLDDQLHIGAGSPAINNGAGILQFEFIPDRDYKGTIRPQGAGVDIGAYERIE